MFWLNFLVWLASSWIAPSWPLKTHFSPVSHSLSLYTTPVLADFTPWTLLTFLSAGGRRAEPPAPFSFQCYCYSCLFLGNREACTNPLITWASLKMVLGKPLQSLCDSTQTHTHTHTHTLPSQTFTQAPGSQRCSHWEAVCIQHGGDSSYLWCEKKSQALSAIISGSLKAHFMLLYVFYNFFFFRPCPTACGILVPWPQNEPTVPLHWKCGFLTTGLPGKSPILCYDVRPLKNLKEWI